MLADDEDSLQLEDSPPPSPDSDKTGGTEETLATLSLKLVGISSTHTMKLVGHIAQKPITVLIDSRATHNFISVETVSAVGMPITATNCYRVLLGTGGKV